MDWIQIVLLVILGLLAIVVLWSLGTILWRVIVKGERL